MELGALVVIGTLTFTIPINIILLILLTHLFKHRNEDFKQSTRSAKIIGIILVFPVLYGSIILSYQFSLFVGIREGAHQQAIREEKCRKILTEQDFNSNKSLVQDYLGTGSQIYKYADAIYYCTLILFRYDITPPHISALNKSEFSNGDEVNGYGTGIKSTSVILEGMGKRIVIEPVDGYNYAFEPNDSQIFRIVLQEGQYCSVDKIHYKNGACPNYSYILPGNYKLYTSYWGVESNKIDLIYKIR